MFLRNSIYPLPHLWALFEYMNGDNDHVSKYMSYSEKGKLG